MNTAGYSGKSLLAKLGYQAGESVFIVNQPRWFRSMLRSGGVIPSGVSPAHWAHGFFETTAEVETFLDEFNFDDIQKGVWVSWPKKASGIKTDLSEQTFRDLILPLGWVDTKVAAIDETWSGLKFLRRRQ